MTPLEQFLHRAEALLARVEAVLPPPVPREPDWKRSFAFRWRKRANGQGKYLQPVLHASTIRLEDLQHVDAQKRQIEQNTRQFVTRRPANNVLLTGARGTGKSSLIKACLNGFAGQGLRLIEVDKEDLADLPDIVDLVAGRPERFVIFCDDLSFDNDDTSYKSLKAALEGGVEGRPANGIFYATSNRRHLLPRDMIDNERSTAINPGEAVEEKVSLSDRFGLWLGFHKCSQDEYLDMIDGYARYHGLEIDPDQLRAEALEWATTRGSRSGRVAWQFTQDLAGRLGQPLRD